MDNIFVATTFDWDHRWPNHWQRRANGVLERFGVPARLTPPAPVLANVENRMNLFFLAEQTAAYGVPGDVCDIGCNAGESTIVLSTVLSRLAPEKVVHAYDSFEGLPEIGPVDAEDGIYKKGCMAADLETFIKKFETLALRLPVIHKGWFEETIPRHLPDRISFCAIDGDLYSSTKHVLPHVYERMSPGAIGIFNVYSDRSKLDRQVPKYYLSPGVKRAADEFFADKPEKVDLLYSGEYTNGYFRKK
jgi:O-methyltransferase